MLSKHSPKGFQMPENSQKEVIDFLSNSKNLPGHKPVEIIRTHGALIFLSGKYAYKIKRNVRYDYLDFSTLQKRHDMLLRELELNAPTAPSIYRDVIAVTRDLAGQLHLEGAGDAVEWVLRMHRFDIADELDKVAARGALDDSLAMDLGKVIAQYHAQNNICSDKRGGDLIRAILDELNAAFATMKHQLDGGEIDHFSTASDSTFRRIVADLNARSGGGHIRRCHGDLHLRNIVLIDGTPTPFDALEFDETLGTSDVLYDLAFLLMDLMHAGLVRAANISFNSYLFHADVRDPCDGDRADSAVQARRPNPYPRGAQIPHGGKQLSCARTRTTRCHRRGFGDRKDRSRNILMPADWPCPRCPAFAQRP